ncbi:NrfD/PsrC family molybdoenzyme membrane anchor subunit [Actinocatenispora rupis]|nr:NrfD/PsrC family molybdoenzyme membrane anchor subunit [Actinocatenispora rupis]
MSAPDRDPGVRRRRRGAEAAMVPEAEFGSYYGRPILKQPVWKVPDVPAYLFLGGMAGGSALLAAFADATGRPCLRRVGRVTASAASLASVGALVHDLGRPARFLNMLRVLKPTSPLSVGSWILAPFTGLAAGAALSDVTGRLPTIGRLAGAGAAVLGPAMATYTAALLADTAVPAWHEAHRELPFVFGGSALASAGAAGMIAAPAAQAGPARRLAVLGAGLELGASRLMLRRLGPLLSEPYHQGRVGRMHRAATVLTAAGAGLGAVAGRRRWLGVAAGVLLAAGSVTTRFAVFEAGRASARDPKYTVVPQRERLAARATDPAGADTLPE